jgi:CheY-like chemotaxis protein
MVILVVDDDEPVLQVMMELLEGLVFRVIGAASGREALTLIRDQTEPDVVISDVNMPGMSGLQLAEELKSMRPFLPVILMSGQPSKGWAQPFLAKPFTLQHLVACILGVTGLLSGAAARPSAMAGVSASR